MVRSGASAELTSKKEETAMAKLDIYQFPTRSDNYGVLRITIEEL